MADKLRACTQCGTRNKELAQREDGSLWCCDCIRLDRFLDRLIGVLAEMIKELKS